MASKKQTTRYMGKREHPLSRPVASPPQAVKKTASSALRSLYAPTTMRAAGYLRVSPLHEIYWEESGNPQGKAAVFLHGGPGAGSDSRAHAFFDPDAYRIIVFDQRGCGRSRPTASLIDNTTWHLIADIEQLREHLGIERWLVFGGSWGSTLALAYAQTHPQRVSELVLRGIFLLRRWELDWFYQQGADALYPERFAAYIKAIPVAERHDLIAAFYRRLTGTDKAEQLRAARAWSTWEASTSFLHVNEDTIEKWDAAEFAIAVARIECHYFVNAGFFAGDDQLLKNIERVRTIPAVIVQGRYDVVCPMKTAWELHQAWPEAEFHVVPDAGHSAFEPGNTHQLIKATDRFRSL